MKFLMIHCTATPESRDYNTKQILSWFTDMGWKVPGYSQVTHLDGRIEVLRDYNADDIMQDSEITNGAKGWNRDARHIAYIGGVASDGRTPKDTRTLLQKDSLAAQVKSFVYRYPHIQVIGHNQVANKACPSFDVPSWCRYIGLLERNISNIKLPSAFVRNSQLFDFKI